MPNSNEVTTEELALALQEIRANQEQQKHERHKINNELMRTVSSFSLNQLKQKDEMGEVRAALGDMAEKSAHMAEDVRKIKNRLIGDDEMQETGLVDDVRKLYEWKAGMETRQHAVEQDNAFVKKLVGVFVSLVTLAGTIIGIISYFKP